MITPSNLPILYKRTETGAVQQWQIKTQGNSFYTIEGQVDGKLTTSRPTLCESKNEDKSNSTTSEEQAIQEAYRKWKKKQENGYNPDIEKIDSTPSFYKPMLAFKFAEYKEDIKYPVFVQRKSDGARCIMTRLGAWTRNGKEWVTVPHIREALKSYFQKFPNAILDGELYTHKLRNDFNKMMSLVKKTKPSLQDLFDAEEMVEYHIYDAPVINGLTEKAPFFDRYQNLAVHLSDVKYIHIVDTYIVNNEEEMTEYYNKFLDEGYEGLMIRMNAPYQNKRTKYLLKVKPEEDEEFTIIGIRHGKGNKSNMAAHADFLTKNGKPFTANIKGTHEYLKELLQKREEVVGLKATVKFQNYTPTGIPRFPYMIAVRNFE